MPQPGRRGPLSRLLFLLAALPLCSCAAARLDVIQVGPWFKARPASEVAVFSSRSETKVPWGGIGIIHSPRFSAADEKKIQAARGQAVREAALMGADGVILVVDAAPDDGRLELRSEPEVFISGLAIKYVPDAKQPEKQP